MIRLLDLLNRWLEARNRRLEQRNAIKAERIRSRWPRYLDSFDVPPPKASPPGPPSDFED